ncbi:MAG: putative porin [Saprospiraceae bacterium]
MVRMNASLRILLILFILPGPFATLTHAQIRDRDLNSIGSSTVTDTLDSGILPLDTPAVMRYVLMNDPKVLHALKDTFTWDDTRHFPLRFDEAHLGNYGSASRTLVPSISYETGFSTGWDQYNSYFIQPDSFRFFNQEVPVTKVKYSQSSKEDTYVSLTFGRSFARGLNLSLIYDRINQIGEFAHQRQKNTALGIGVWHNSPSGKYDAFYILISNAAVAEENGGVSDPDSIGNPRWPDIRIPVNVLTGLTTHKHRSFGTKQILHLINNSAGPGFDLWLKENYSTELYKYADENATDAASYYGTEYLPDQRGIRQFTFEKENQLSGGIALPWAKARTDIQTSLRFRSISLQQEPISRNISELFWEGTGDFHWIKALELKGEFSLGLGQANGSYLFRASGVLNSGVVGRFSGYWSFASRKPYMVETSLFVDQTQIYQSHFNNPFTNDIGVRWDWENQHLHAGINWLIFDNYIYFDTAGLPAQISNSFSLKRFYAGKEFNLPWIGLKGQVVWQPDAKEELAIPNLLYTAGFYGRIKIFEKKVTLLPGVDVTFHDAYHGITYFPVNGRYHLTNGQNIPEYFRIDAALGMRIRFIKAFVRMEDIAGLWEKRVLYQADYYPHYSGYFRIGIEAGFFN